MSENEKKEFGFGYSPEDVELAACVCEEYSAMIEETTGNGELIMHADVMAMALRDYALAMRGEKGHGDEDD